MQRCRFSRGGRQHQKKLDGRMSGDSGRETRWAGPAGRIGCRWGISEDGDVMEIRRRKKKEEEGERVCERE